MSKKLMAILCSCFAGLILIAGIILAICLNQNAEPVIQGNHSSASSDQTVNNSQENDPSSVTETPESNTESLPTVSENTPSDTTNHPSSQDPSKNSSTIKQNGSWDSIMIADNVKASKVYYVSQAGSDYYPGTQEKPFKTLNYAQAAAAKFRSQVNGDITIHVAAGEYRLPDTLNFDETTFSDGSHKLIFKADGKVTVSGGKDINNWESVKVNGISMYKAKVPGVEYIRQFYLNDTAQPRAALEGEYSWNFKSANDKSAVVINDVDLSNIYDASALELKWKVEWKLFIHLASSVSQNVVRMQQPYFKFTTGAIDAGVDPEGYYYPNPNRHTVTLSNDLSFLDQPGEWYFDQKNQELYFYPPKGTDLSKAKCTVPVLEEFINMTGTAANKVKNIEFDGFTFKYAAMNLISRYGLAINQAQTYISGIATNTNGSVSMPIDMLKGSINLEYTQGVRFTNCTFKNLGSAAIRVSRGAHYTTIQGCKFTDMSDSAVIIGDPNNAAAADGSKTLHTVFSNNVIRRVAKDYTAMPAVSGYYAAYTQITHNDIAEVPYSAITLGWGWGHDTQYNGSHNNTISYNRIDNYLMNARDGGGIYTLGHQKDSVIEGNYISNQGNAFGGIYLDEGSAYFTVKNNVVDNNQQPGNEELCWLWVNGRDIDGKLSCYQLQLMNNYTSNTRQHTSWQTENCSVKDTSFITNGQWPDAAKKIMEESGLTSEYAYLLNNLK